MCPCLVSGSVKAIGSQWALSNKSKVSPTIGSPRSFSSLIRSPASRTPRHRTNPAFQSSSDISSPGRAEERDVLDVRAADGPAQEELSRAGRPAGSSR